MLRYLVILLVSMLTVCSVYAQSSFKEADKLYALGNYTKAIEVYQSLSSQDSVYHKIAMAYRALGNYDESIAHYKKAIHANPENIIFQFEYAKLLRLTKKYIEAKDIYESLIESDSLNPNFHYELGLLLEKKRDTLAIQKFIKTFELDDTHQKAIFKIAKHQIRKRKFKEARELVNTGLASYDSNVQLISLKAQSYYFEDAYEDAKVWFKKLLDLGENSEFIHEKLSICYAQNSDYKDAIYHRKEALKFSPNDADAMFVIGGYYERLSNFEKAEEYYRRSLLLSDIPLDKEYQKLGIVLNRQKKHKEALKQFQKAKKENPEDIMTDFFILRTKDEYYADIDSKIKLYEDFLEVKKDNPFKIFAEKRLKELKEEKFQQKK